MSYAHESRKLRRAATHRAVCWLLAILLVTTAFLPLASIVPPAYADDPMFTRRPFGTGTDSTLSMVMGDVNGDGALDIVANQYEQSLVYLNDRAGHFASGPVDCIDTVHVRCFGSATGNFDGIAVGDMDGDGTLDLVTWRYEQQNAIYLNDGQGYFSTGTVDCADTVHVRCFGTSRYSFQAVGDINGDGALDLIGATDSQSLVYLNDGQGHFANGAVDCTDTARVRCFDPNAGIYGMAGDINGDGALDLIGATDSQSLVYLNDGQGYFSTNPIDCADTVHMRCFGSNAAWFQAAGDINGDGALDLIAKFYSQRLVYLNDGGGHFASGPLNCADTARVRCFGPNSDGHSVAMGDINGDGALDLVIDLFDGFSVRQMAVYLNDGSGHFATGPLDCTNTARMRCFGPSDQLDKSTAIGDVDGDGALDLALGIDRGQNAIYLNNGAGTFLAGRILNAPGLSDVVVADINGDSALDLVASTSWQQNAAYLNDGEGTPPPREPRPRRRQHILVYHNDGSGHFAGGTSNCSDSALVGCVGIHFLGSVAVEDINDDGAVDLIVANEANSDEQNVIYLNDGDGHFVTGSVDCADTARVRCFGSYPADSLVVGDINNDGALDLITTHGWNEGLVYLNDGSGHFVTGPVDCADTARVRCFGPNNGIYSGTYQVGDINGDGALDLIASSDGQSLIYLNDGGGYFATGPLDCVDTARVRCFGPSSGAYNTAVGDINGDGALDLIASSDGQSLIYLNDGGGHFATGPLDCADTTHVRCIGETDRSSSRAVGDLNGDGALDLIASSAGLSAVYLNDGTGTFLARRTFGGMQDSVASLAVGDLNGDGASDFAVANYYQLSKVYLNGLAAAGRLTNNPPHVTVRRPGPTANADLLSSPAILSSRVISVPYTLADPEGDAVRFIRAFYSPDGGGRWLPAVAATGTISTNLATDCLGGCAYTYLWDTFASGFFGKSDDVVFRIEAYPGLGVHPARQPVGPGPQPTPSLVHKVFLPLVGQRRTTFAPNMPGPYQRPYAAAQTFPFRVRGTQVRVLQQDGQPARGAYVYRLPADQARGAQPFTDGGGQPFRTDALGYLQGRGRIDPGDRLIALQPITATDTYTLYATNAVPTPTGLDAYTVSTPGVQTLTVSPANPLILFNLQVSLEWDARADPQFLSQLESDFKRASEFLYDWTNGQAALGNITVYQAKQRWNDAHIRIYATNRLRPNANQGGIVSRVISDTLTPAIRYAPGQLRMGAVWNRYGEASGTLGEDWPRTLAHELGHYALYLDDDYIGLDADGVLVPITTCTGTAMSDPYRDDYSEFHPAADWLPGCAGTLSNQETGRADWSTIATFYPQLNTPDGPLASVNTGPSILPLEVTRVQVVDPDPAKPTDALSVPIFLLARQEDHSSYLPSSGARAFLFRRAAGPGSPISDTVDLGSPTLDQVLARGARPGDRLCVYDLAAGRMGCQENIIPTDQQLPMTTTVDWQPDIAVTPVTSTTVAISVTNVPDGLPLKARLFPAGAAATPEQALAPAGAGQYAGSFSLPQPTFEGYVQVWVDEATTPRREAMTSYALGGNPGEKWGRDAPRGGPGEKWGRDAPVISSDGQAILFGKDIALAEGQFFGLQAITSVPPPPPWATVVGSAYRLTANLPLPDNMSISFSYLGRDVPPGQEEGLRIYHWNAAGRHWEMLPTVLNPQQNNASAPIQEQGPYALMSSIAVPIDGPGWNLIAYPIQGTRPITEALASIDGFYTTVYGYDRADAADPWKVYDVDAPAWVNDLHELEFGHGYWIRATEAITLYLKGGASATLTAASATAGSVPIPPATYYGAVLPSPSFTPTEGMPVRAFVHGTLCGQGQTLPVDGQIVYTVNVTAGAGGSAGCGAAGQKVRFEVGGRQMATTAPWNNDRVWELALIDRRRR